MARTKSVDSCSGMQQHPRAAPARSITIYFALEEAENLGAGVLFAHFYASRLTSAGVHSWSAMCVHKFCGAPA